MSGLRSTHCGELSIGVQGLCRDLKIWGEEVDTGHWQGVATEGKPDLVTRELLDATFSAPALPEGGSYAPLGYWVTQLHPNTPWADDHFEERVSRVPSNPGEEYKNWPWWRGQDEAAMERVPRLEHPAVPDDLIFTHTYQERFWPKYAGEHQEQRGKWGWWEGHPHGGVRYPYGDLDDVVNLLLREPHTRQAYFPIYFPEDTGSVHGGRTPCSLGYHFMLRNNKLHMWYTIRSCDAVRHFRDDVYLALRLQLWVLQELRDRGRPEYWDRVQLGNFYFKAFSFHVHMGDFHLLEG